MPSWKLQSCFRRVANVSTCIVVIPVSGMDKDYQKSSDISEAILYMSCDHVAVMMCC